jgi:hypothetical protein
MTAYIEHTIREIKDAKTTEELRLVLANFGLATCMDSKIKEECFRIIEQEAQKDK